MKITNKYLLIYLTAFLFNIPAGLAHEHHDIDVKPSGELKRSAYQSKMDKIMSDMHHGMSNVKITGNDDIDFMKMMIPHHQGAIDMSRLILEESISKEVKTWLYLLLLNKKTKLIL